MKRLLGAVWIAALVGGAGIAEGKVSRKRNPTPLARSAGKASPVPGPVSSPTPSPLPKPSETPVVRVQGLLQRMSLRPLDPKRAPPVRLLVPKLPLELQSDSAESKPPKKWKVEVLMESSETGLAVLSGNHAARFKNGTSVLNLELEAKSQRVPLSLIRPTGDVSDFELELEIEAKATEVVITDPKGFFVLGPALYSRTITRAGVAAGSSAGTASGWVAGVRSIYRRRVLRSLTDHMPGSFKAFLDGSATLARSVVGDEGMVGTPLFLDGRLTFDLFSKGIFRVEGGLGSTFFAPLLARRSAGDLDYYWGLTATGRVGFPISSRFQGLIGFSASLPSLASNGTDTLVNTPLEFFGSVSFARGNAGYMEARLKYYRMSTAGSVVGAGAFERLEEFFGPEVLWIWKF